MTNNFPLRKKVILGTSLALSSVFSYAKRSYAACISTGFSTYVCSSDDALTPLSVRANNANVTISNVGDFVIDLDDNDNADGLRVRGEGAISFTSGDNASISVNANALRIISFVDETDGTNGSININTNGSKFYAQNYTAIYSSVDGGRAGSEVNITSSTVAGFDNGLFFSQSGAMGNLNATIVDSDISAANPLGHGIKIESSDTNSNITLTSDANSNISGGANAISIYRNSSTDAGDTDITVNGNLTATNNRGLYLTTTSAGDVDISTGENSYIRSKGQGIRLISSGAGETNLALSGDIKSEDEEGVLIRTQYSGSALNLTINEASSIKASNSNHGNPSNAVEIINRVNGAAIINVSGDLTADNGRAFYMKSENSASNISLTFAESSTLSTRSNSAVRLSNSGTGFTNVTINGVASSAAYDTAVLLFDNADSGALTFTTGENSVISAGAHPSSIAYDGVKIYAGNNHSSTITINGDVSSANRHGFYLIGLGYSNSVGDITMTTGAQSKISGVLDAVKLNNLGLGQTSVTIAGEVESSNGIGANIRSSNADNNEALTFTTATNSSIIAKEAGVTIFNRGADVAQLDIRGNIIAQGEAAIYVDSTAGANITLQDGVQLVGNRAIHNSQNRLNLTLDGSAGAVSLKGNSGVAVNFGAQNDRLIIKGLVSLDGSVNGGNGNDLLEMENANLTLVGNSEIAGFETVNFSGSNIINGDIDFSQVQINIAQGGGFKLNGNAKFDELTVQSGSSLSGNSTMEGDIIIASGATVAPGNSVGAINIVGDFTFNNGAIFDVEFDNSGADKIVASGNVTINNGAIVNITKINGSSPNSASYKIIEAAQIKGKFGTQNIGNNVSLLYAVDSRSLNLINFNTNVLKSQNQSLVGSAILFNDSITDQIAENAFAKNKNFWIRNIYRNRDIASDEGISARDNSYGIAFGGEMKAANPAYKIGFSLSQISNNLNLKNNQGSKKSDAIFAAIYATYNAKINGNDFFTSLSLASGVHDSNNSRQVANNNVSSYSKSETQDRDFSATIQGGLKFLAKNNWQISPRISATYIKTKAAGFSETDGGLAAVSIDDYSFETLKFRESLRFSKHDFKAFRGIGLVPYFEAGLAQERSIGKQEISGSFVSGDRFSTKINQRNRNFVSAAIGLQMTVSKDVSAFLNYETSRSKEEKRYDGRVGFNVKF